MAKVLFVVAAAIIMLMNGISAEKYTVGGEQGWSVPPSEDFYSSWAAKHSFEVDDTLVFNFNAGHTVAMVSRDGYDQCDAGNSEVHTVGPTEITLNQTGSHYFICTVDGHCDAGLKLAVIVGSAVAPMSVDTGYSPPKTPISTFLYVGFMAFILGFLYY